MSTLRRVNQVYTFLSFLLSVFFLVVMRHSHKMTARRVLFCEILGDDIMLWTEKGKYFTRCSAVMSFNGLLGTETKSSLQKYPLHWNNVIK